MPHEFDSARPIYLQLSELVTRAILAGEYAPGEKLPGVRELAAKFGVNPNTAQRTMAELERLGLVYSERTAGRFVTADQNLISEIRRQAAAKETREYLDRMTHLGLRLSEVQTLLTQVSEIKERSI